MILRAATRADVPLVRRTLYTALSWDPADPIPRFETVVTHPEIAIYHDGWMREGDDGVVAQLEDGAFAGMAYCRRFSEEDPAQGFVDPTVPELAVGVEPEYRNRGIGRKLIRRLHESRAAAGVRRMSLSVSAENPALRLYEQLGYREVRRHDVAIVMVTELDTRG